jgi:hypothetical protein
VQKQERKQRQQQKQIPFGDDKEEKQNAGVLPFRQAQGQNDKKKRRQ